MRTSNHANYVLLPSASMRMARGIPPVRGRDALLILALLALSVIAGYAADRQPVTQFTKVADTTSGFAGFGTMPAINNSGAVAFIASGANFGEGVFRWQHGKLETIASRMASGLSNFGDDVVINCSNVVAFDANLQSNAERIIFTSDGQTLTPIADSVKQQLAGGPFLGLGTMNCAGTVAFLGFRAGFQSQAIFAGNGGPLEVLEDTLNSNFTAFGNQAINNSGDLVFHGFRSDGSEGIFAGQGGSFDIVDTNNPTFAGFLDPVINDDGVVASAAFLSGGGMEVFTGTGSRFTARTDPAGPLTFIDNVSINNEGNLAFFAEDSGRGQGLYIEGREAKAPVAFLKSGDSLFGSVVTGLKNGRFSLNDRNEVVFLYSLQDGRSGIAIARLGEVE